MKHIIPTLTLVAASLTFGQVHAEVIKEDVSKITNDKAYYMSFKLDGSLRSLLIAAEGEDGKTILDATANTVGNRKKSEAQWSIHYSAKEQNYYLYNLHTKQFIEGNKNNVAVFTDTPQDAKLLWQDEAGLWLIDTGGALLGLPESKEGAVLYTAGIDEDRAKALGYYIQIGDISGVTISEEEQAEIEAKIAEGRTAKLKEYKTFAQTAEKQANNSLYTGYIGIHDVTRLKEMLDNADKYSIQQFEEAYQQALLTGFPDNGSFYRLHNYNRPEGNTRQRSIAVTTGGKIVSRGGFDSYAYNTAGNGYQDDLSLLTVVYPVPADPTKVMLRLASQNKYIGPAANNGKPVLVDRDEAQTFIVDNYSTRNPSLTLRQAGGVYLTVNPNGELVGYNQTEAACAWYFEKVTSINVTTDANGYCALTVPCILEIPEGVTAYTATDVSGGKVYMEELKSPVASNTPMIIKGAASTTISLPLGDQYQYQYSAMKGNTVAMSNAPARYVLESTPAGIAFKAAAAGRIAPGQAYIVTDHTGDLEVVMGANPEAGIAEITAEEAGEMRLYDIHGRKVSGENLRPGLYIDANAKKVIRVK